MKSIFTSKTAWLGIIVAVLGALQGLDGAHLVTDPHVAGYVASGLGVSMIALRWITTQPVSVTAPVTLTDTSK